MIVWFLAFDKDFGTTYYPPLGFWKNNWIELYLILKILSTLWDIYRCFFWFTWYKLIFYSAGLFIECERRSLFIFPFIAPNYRRRLFLQIRIRKLFVEVFLCLHFSFLCCMSVANHFPDWTSVFCLLNYIKEDPLDVLPSILLLWNLSYHQTLHEITR